MFLSIIIPVYNTEQYIRQCVLSCLQEVNFEYEIIIIDDGTPDNSIEIISDLIAEHDIIKLYRQKNKGLSIARNVGLEYAKGDYVWFVDSDDWLVDGAIAKIAENIEYSTDSQIVAFNANYLYRNNTVVADTPLNNKTKINGFDFLLTAPLYSVWRLWYNRKYLLAEKIQFIKGLLHEDNDFNFRALVFAKQVIYLTIAAYNYRPNRNGSIMNTISLQRACTGFDYLYLSEELLYNKKLKSAHITYLSYERLFSLHWDYFQMYNSLNRADKKIFKRELSKARMLIVKYILKSNNPKYLSIIPLVLLSPYAYMKLMIYLKNIQSNQKYSVDSMLGA